MSLKPQDQRLTFGEDPKLSTRQSYPDAVSSEIQRPPGINTLREWGQLQIPSGKFVNKTFEEAHADLGYVRQMWSRGAVSAWVRSFQMYCRARSQMTSAYVHKQHDMGINVDLNQLMVETTKDEVLRNAENKVSPEPVSMSAAKSAVAVKSQGAVNINDWIKIEEDAKPSAESSRSTKRGSANTQSGNMKIEPNPERVQALRTQIAILERELAKETKVPDDKID